MPGYVVALGALTLVAVAAFAPPRWALGTLLATLLLVPATLAIPNGLTPLPTVGRVVTLAALAALAVRVRHGRLLAAPGQDAPFASTPVHLALGAWLVAAYLAGVVAATPTTPPATTAYAYVGLLEQAGVFVAVLGLLRVVGDTRWMLRLLAVLLLASVAVALVEHVSGRSFGQTLFAGLPSQAGTDAAHPLEGRLGDVRVRAGAEFALEFGWITAALVPTLTAVWVLARRRLTVTVAAAAALLATATAIYWSYARSAPVGVGVGLLVLAAGSRHRRALAVALAVAAAVGVAVLLAPSLLDVYQASVAQGSLDVRAQRLPVVLGLVAAHPFTGLGLGGLVPLGLSETDSSYLQAYAETGAVGLAVLLVTLATAVAVAARGLAARDPLARVAPAAALGGALALLVGAGAFDALDVLGSARLFWVLVAVAVAAAEPHVGPLRARLPRLRPTRLALPVAGAALGAVVFALTPRPAAASYLLSTLPVSRETGGYDPVTAGRTLVGTACGAARAWAADRPVRVDCRDTFQGAGTATLRIQAASLAGLRRDTGALGAVLVRDARLRYLRAAPVQPGRVSRPSWAGTAPAVGAVVGAGAALLLPSRRRRRG